MKIREKISIGVKSVKSTSLVKRVENSKLLGQGKTICAKCVKNPFPVQVACTILYRLALDVLYIALLSPMYAYSGFTLDVSPLRYLVSLLTVVIFAPIVVRLMERRNPSSVLVSLINYMYFIPLTSYYGCKGADMQWFLVCIAYWAILLVLQSFLPVIKLAPLSAKHVHLLFKGVTVLSVLFILFVSGKYTGFRLTLNFIDVYGIRIAAREYDIPTLFAYVLGAMPTILSILLLYWLKNKKYITVGILLVTYLLMYSIAALKGVFFLLLLVLAGYFLYHDWMLKWLPSLLVPAVGAALLEYKAINSFSIMALFFRRMMYAPVNLSETYYAFAQEQPKNLFRDGIMGKFSFDNIYSITIPRIIGEYVGEPQMSANNGLLGDIFANIPIPLGLLLLPLILIICFRLLDMAAVSQDRKLLLPFCVYFANSFMNSSWSTVLLSHGFLIACIMLYLFPKEEYKLS